MTMKMMRMTKVMSGTPTMKATFFVKDTSLLAFSDWIWCSKIFILITFFTWSKALTEEDVACKITLKKEKSWWLIVKLLFFDTIFLEIQKGLLHFQHDFVLWSFDKGSCYLLLYFLWLFTLLGVWKEGVRQSMVNFDIPIL